MKRLNQYSKRRTQFLALVLLYLSLAFPHIGNADPATIAIFPGAAPVSFIDEAGDPQGINVDLLGRIFGDAGVEYEFVVTESFAAAFDSVSRGEIDLLPALLRTQERERLFDFNRVPTQVSWSQVYLPPGSSIESVFDLSNRRVGLMEGDQNGKNFIELMESFGIPFEASVYSDFTEVEESILANRIDAGVMFSTYFQSESKLTPSNIVFAPNAAYVGAQKGSQRELLAIIDERLAEAKSDNNSYYYDILAKWSGLESKKATPRWIVILLVSVIGAAVALVLFVWLLNRRIADARREIVRREKRFRAIFNMGQDAMYVHGFDQYGNPGRFLEVNDAAVKKLGYSREALLSLSPRDITPSTRTDRQIRENVLKTAREGVSLFETIHRTAKGDPIPVEVHAATHTLDDEEVLIAVARDISEREERVRELLESRSILELSNEISRLFLDTPGDVVYPMARDLLIEQIGATRGYFGYRASGTEIVCSGPIRDAQDLSLLAGTSERFTIDTWEEHWRDDFGEVSRRWIAEARAGDDTFVSTRCAVFLPIRANHEIVGHLGLADKPEGFTSNDIHLLEGIVRQIGPVVASRREREDIENHFREAQKMEVVGRLAGGVAHDFNNLLQVINGHAEVALTELQVGSESRRDIEQILTATNRAGALVRQLLALGRKQPMDMKILDLGTVVDSMIGMVRAAVGERIEVIFERPGMPCPIRADRGQIEQVVTNLCMNARDAMSDGGSLTIRVVPLVDLSSDDESRIILEVEDSGQGMESEVLERVFEPFFTTKGSAKGTGLGMASVYGIVHQHDGHVDIASEPNLGTTVSVSFPGRRIGLAQESDETYPQAENSRGTETILVAEDEPAVRSLIERILENSGYRVLVAANGVEAVEIFRTSGRVDLVVTDVIMPEMSGNELYERIRAVRPEMPALFVSGYRSDYADLASYDQRRTAILNKPFTRNELLSAVGRLIGKAAIPDR